MGGHHRRLATVIATIVGVISFVVLSSTTRLYLGFMAAVGIGYWIKDVRNSAGEKPKWLSLVLGAAIWLGLAAAAVSLRTWADRYLNGVNVSVWAALLFIVALFFLGFGAWLYLATPSPRVVERWEQMPWDIGMMCAFLPIGVTMLLWFGAFGLPVGDTLTMDFFWIGAVVALVGLLLFFWQPRWVRPRWMRDLE